MLFAKIDLSQEQRRGNFKLLTNRLELSKIYCRFEEIILFNAVDIL